MQRFLATFLIALVGAMALVPHALCPCALRARAEAARAEAAGGAQALAEWNLPACCERCRARVRATAKLALPGADVLLASSPAEQQPDAPSCPCCAVSGKGKNLLQPGASVKPLELTDAGPATEPTGASFVASPAAALLVEGPEEPPSVRPPALLRAGVVLLI